MFIFHFQPISHKEGVPVSPGRYTVFFVMLMVAAIITAGCSSFPLIGTSTTKAPEKVDIGFSATPASTIHETYSFDRFLSILATTGFENESDTTVNTTPGRQVLYIRGLHMDGAGNAESWMGVVRHGSATSLFTYDKFGEKISGWNTSITSQDIPMDRILTPARLFNQSHAIIFSRQQETSPDPMTLELGANTYTLTITGRDNIRILKFDALTGALTESNE